MSMSKLNALIPPRKCQSAGRAPQGPQQTSHQPSPTSSASSPPSSISDLMMSPADEDGFTTGQTSSRRLAASDRNAFYFDHAPDTEPTAVLLHHKLPNGVKTSGKANSVVVVASAVRSKSNMTAMPVPQNLHELRLNLSDEPHEKMHAWDNNNHRIYAIDELSEVSGRSEAVELHERQRALSVQQIVANQEHNARLTRPVSRRGFAQPVTALQTPPPAKEAKSVKPLPSPFDSPHYGYVDSPPSTIGRQPFHKCRIVIPNIEALDSTAASGRHSRTYEAYIFDLELTATSPVTSHYHRRRQQGAQAVPASHNHQSSATRASHHRNSVDKAAAPLHPSTSGGIFAQTERTLDTGHSTTTRTNKYEPSGQYYQRHYTDGGGTSMLTRSQAVPAQKAKSSCCGCFGFGSSSRGGGGGSAEQWTKWRGGREGRRHQAHDGGDHERDYLV